AYVSLYQLPLVFVLLKNKSVSLAHLAASSSNAFLFFNLAFSAPPGLFLPSILPDAYCCGRAGPAIGSLSENTFWKRQAMDPTNSIWEGRTSSHGTTHAEAAVSECGMCVAYFKRRWTNVTNVKKSNSRPAQK